MHFARTGALAFGLALTPLPPPVDAQDADWNGVDALALVQTARAARRSLAEGPRRTAYEARADGHVYFYLDREDGAPPVPLRVDQLSLDVTWRPPGRTRQLLRATRGRELLPIEEMRYYSDRFALAEGTYADRIRVGDGRDVRGVPHPLSEASSERYDFRLGSTLVLQAGGGEPRRITELIVRPRNAGSPAFVGSIHVDESTGGIARMDFTFTDVSYADPRNDYVRVRLEFMLWDDDVWLPRMQTIEVRRESTVIELPLGTVIRSRIEVSDYVALDGSYAPRVGDPPVVADGSTGADTARFRGGLLDRMAAEGLDGSWSLPDLSWSELREFASSGGGGVRLYTDRLSSALRVTRVEGVRVGAGVSVALGEVRVESLAGYAFGAHRPSATVALSGSEARLRPRLRAEWLELKDAGWPGSGYDVLGSLAMLTSGEDRLDPYLSTGVRGSLTTTAGPRSWTVGARVERHESVTGVWSESPLLGQSTRPVRPIEPGTEVAGELGVRRGWPVGEASLLRHESSAHLGAWRGSTFAELRSSWLVQLPGVLGANTLEGSLDAAARFGATPVQRLYFLGGPNTLPGHRWRRWAGTGVALLTVRSSREIAGPVLGAEAFLSVGLTAGSAAGSEAWGVESGGPPRASVGVGVTSLGGMIRLRLARGIGDGRTALFLVLDPSMRDLF